MHKMRRKSACFVCAELQYALFNFKILKTNIQKNIVANTRGTEIHRGKQLSLHCRYSEIAVLKSLIVTLPYL